MTDYINGLPGKLPPQLPDQAHKPFNWDVFLICLWVGMIVSWPIVKFLAVVYK